MTPTSNAAVFPTHTLRGGGEVPFDIHVRELKRRRDNGESPAVIDVREPMEFRMANIGGQLIPLGVLPGRMHELDRTKEIIVLCHHGNRSRLATEILRRNGFTLARNLDGGIDAWSQLIDPSVPRY